MCYRLMWDATKWKKWEWNPFFFLLFLHKSFFSFDGMSARCWLVCMCVCVRCVYLLIYSRVLRDFDFRNHLNAYWLVIAIHCVWEQSHSPARIIGEYITFNCGKLQWHRKTCAFDASVEVINGKSISIVRV